MKTHLTDKRWYVHIADCYGLPDVRLLHRGDSDPMIMYRGQLYDYYDIDNYLNEEYEEECRCTDEEITFDEWLMDDDTLPMFYMYLDEWSNHEYKSHHNQSENPQPRNTMPLNTNQQVVLNLATTLSDVSEYVEGNLTKLEQDDYDAHHCNIFTISQQCGDYQVFRMFDVEIEPVDPMEQATEEERKSIEKAEQDSGYYDNEWEDMIERMYEDGLDPYHTYEYGECAQMWLNTKTNEVVMLGKPYDEDERCCDWDRPEWEIINLTASEGRSAKFRGTFMERYGSGHYMDLDVHPFLLSRGYEPLDATDWYYGCGEDGNRTDEAQFFYDIWQHEGWIGFMQELVAGSSWERKFKQFGFHNVMKAETSFKADMDEYLTAIKICRRNNYTPTDQGLWEDMIRALIYLKKDLHNAHFVCPENLNEAHDKYTKMAENKKRREEQLARIRADKERMERNRNKVEFYLNYVAPYTDIILHNEQHTITVCPTPEAMMEEGRAMHHCVGGYWERMNNNLILFCRSSVDGSRISTIEVRHDSRWHWEIVQNRGLSNSVPPNKEAIDQLINQNFALFTEAHEAYEKAKRDEERRKRQEEAKREKVLIPAGREPEPQPQLAAIPMAA